MRSTYVYFTSSFLKTLFVQFKKIGVCYHVVNPFKPSSVLLLYNFKGK